MDPENPYAPSSSMLAAEANEGDTLAPVPIETLAILSRCWELFLRSPGLVLGAVFIPIVPTFGIVAFEQLALLAMSSAEDWARNSGGDGFATLLALSGALLQFVLSIVSWAISIYFQLGMVRIFSRVARGVPATLTLLFGELVRVPSAVVASLVFGFAMFVGFVALVVPAVIVWLGFQLFLYALVDQDLGPIASLQESWRLTDGHKMALLIVNLLLMAFGLVAICGTCGIGYFAVVPVLSLAQAVIYHSLLHLQGPRLEGP